MRLSLAHSLLPHWKRTVGSRTSTSVGVLLAAVVLAGVGACYTSPINMAPTVVIVQQNEAFRNSDVSFMAEPSDPDNDPVDVAWNHTAGACDRPPDEFPADGLTYSVSAPDTSAPFCVWARVTDNKGAKVDRPKPISPAGRSPTGELVVTGKETNGIFRLYSEIVLDASSGGGPDLDGDPVVVSWRIYEPNTQNPLPDDATTCFDSTVTHCLTPQVSGVYRVEVTLDDHRDAPKTIIKEILVAEDAPPCLITTMPDLETWTKSARPDEPVQITVMQVDDDGDPYDGRQDTSQIQFKWYRQEDAGPMRLDSRTTPYYPIGRDEYRLGQKVRVRLEILDRDRDRSRRLLAKCGDTDSCSTGPDCQQRMTWTVTYSQ